MNTEFLKVAANSNSSSLAGALNQAIKTVAIARGFVAPRGIDLVCIPTFADVQIGEETRTSIKLYVEPRR